MLQFGKCGPRRYICDFLHPLSPLQAFATLLSAFKWTG